MHNARMRERVVTKHQYNELKTRYALCDNIANHMGYIYPLILYDRFGFSFKKVTNFYKKTVELRQQWQDNDNEQITSEWLAEYAFKKGIDVLGYVNAIPMSKKLFLADIRKNRCPIGATANINYAFLSTILLTVHTLKESYRFSNEKIGQFFDWITYYIDLYTTKQPTCKDYYMSDKEIWKVFVIDEAWDINKGEKVEGDVYAYCEA